MNTKCLPEWVLESATQAGGWDGVTMHSHSLAPASLPCPGTRVWDSLVDRGFLSHSWLQRGNLGQSPVTKILAISRQCSRIWRLGGMFAPRGNKHMPISCHRPSSKGYLMVGPKAAASSKFLFIKGLSLKVEKKLYRYRWGRREHRIHGGDCTAWQPRELSWPSQVHYKLTTHSFVLTCPTQNVLPCTQ